MTEPPRPSPTVFVVYTGPDAPVAGRLTEALRAAGIDASYDKDLLPGDIWDHELPRLLDIAPIIAVLISESWDVGWYNKAEVAKAIALVRESKGAKRLVPVLLGDDAAAHMPYGLERLVHVPLPDREPASIERAVDAFRRILGDDGPAPPPPPEDPDDAPASRRAGLLAGSLTLLGALVWLLVSPGDTTDAMDAIIDVMPDAIVDAYVLPPPIAPFDGGPPDPEQPYRPAAVWIPAARAPLGRPADAGGVPDSSRRRTVEIPAPLWVMITPVTRAQYRALVGDLPAMPSGFGGVAPPTAPDGAPVTAVTVDEATAFASALSARDGYSPPHHWRLPTEDEWEYICRAGGPTDDAGPVGPRTDFLPRVGGPPNAWGVRDLLGVVHQWTATPFLPGADQATAERVHRGGDHRTSNRASLRCSYRRYDDPATRARSIGFRLVRTAE